MIEIVFIRHPETEGNILTNSEMTKLPSPNHMFRLSACGLEQMKAVCEYMKTHIPYHPRAVFHSTAFRTRILAASLSRKYEMSNVIEDSRLNEKWDGIFHSLSHEEINNKYPEQIELREKYGWYHYTPFGGENGPAVEMRIRSFFRDLGEDTSYHGGKVIIVGHGNWFHLFEGIARRQPWEEIERERKQNPVPNCSISIYRFTPPNTFQLIKSRIVVCNDSTVKYA